MKRSVLLALLGLVEADFLATASPPVTVPPHNATGAT